MDKENWRAVVKEHDALVEALRRSDAPDAALAAQAHAGARSWHETAATD